MCKVKECRFDVKVSQIKRGEVSRAVKMVLNDAECRYRRDSRTKSARRHIT
jgi:hypothetical protein